MRCRFSSSFGNKWRSQRSLSQGYSKETEFLNLAHIRSSVRGPYGAICFLLKHLLSCRLVSIFCLVCNHFCTFMYDFIINIAMHFTSSSAMAERLCDACSSKGWVTLCLNFRLKCYVLRQCSWTIRWGNGYVLQLCCWKFAHKEILIDFRHNSTFFAISYG